MTGATLGVDNLVWVVSAATAVSLAPFAVLRSIVVLLSIVFRVATVAKRTLSVGPFILRETTRTDDLDWE